MTTLDKAFIKVFEQDNAPKHRRHVDQEESKRELFVDPPLDEVPAPTIAQPTPSEAPEEMPAETAPGESPSFVVADLATTLDSFVVQQNFDIPVLDEISEPVSEPELPEEPVTVTEPIRDFAPAWEVDGFELPQASVRMNTQLCDPLTEFAAQLLQKTGKEKNVVSVHSQSRGEGRTTLTIALALAAAQSGANVLVVDADFDKPSLSRELGLAVEIGWEKSIASEVPISECSVRSIGDGFTILPLADTAATEESALLRRTIPDILAKLSVHFDLILVDAQPGQVDLGDSFDDLVASRVVVRDVRRTDSRLMLQFMSSLSASVDQSVEAIDNFA